MGTPTRYPSGVTNVTKQNPLGMYTQPDPSGVHQYFNYFDTYTAGQWTVSGAGTSTEALTDGDGGLLLLTTDVLEDDASFLQKVGESFLLAAGKKTWFKARFKVSDATQTDIVMGLQVTDSSPLDATDGVYFQSDDGDALLDVYCRKNATTGSTSATGIATLANDTFVEVAWYYDGVDEISYFVNGVQLGTLDASSTYLPDTELTVSLGVQAGSAGAKTMTVDYVLASKAR